MHVCNCQSVCLCLSVVYLFGTLYVITMFSVVPIPGGCSTVSPLEYDANIYLTFNRYTTVWKFSDANLGFNAANDSGPLICDNAYSNGCVPVKSLDYYTYIYYLPERSYAVSHMFDGIEKMLSSSGVTSHGDKVRIVCLLMYFNIL